MRRRVVSPLSRDSEFFSLRSMLLSIERSEKVKNNTDIINPLKLNLFTHTAFIRHIGKYFKYHHLEHKYTKKTRYKASQQSFKPTRPTNRHGGIKAIEGEET